jgi:hypothetical protein
MIDISPMASAWAHPLDATSARLTGANIYASPVSSAEVEPDSPGQTVILPFVPSRRLVLSHPRVRCDLMCCQANALVTTAIEDGRIDELGIVVLDEMYMIDEAKRG